MFSPRLLGGPWSPRNIQWSRAPAVLSRPLHRTSVCLENTAKGKAYADLIIGVPRERFPNEKRVGLTPQVSTTVNVNAACLPASTEC